MKAVYFIELVDGTKLYKCDTFWSKSKEIENAKIHDDSKYDQERFFKSLISGFKPWSSKNEEIQSNWSRIEKYKGSKYGYQIISENSSDINGNQIGKPYHTGTIELSEPVYLTQIEDITENCDVIAPTITSYKRDNKINQILN